MEILAIPGSVRDDSYNASLLKAISSLAPDNINITLFDELKYIPIFEPDLPEDKLPEPVNFLMSKIRASDGVIISTPEYAHGVPGVLKNMLDWLVASDAMILKPVMLTSVSTSGLGGLRSHSQLVLTLCAMNANVVVEASLNVPYARNKFNNVLELTDSLTKKAIDISLSFLERAVKC